MPPFSTFSESVILGKNYDGRVLFKDHQVTVSFPDDNKPGFIFLSVTISDLSLFLELKLASEPFT